MKKNGLVQETIKKHRLNEKLYSIYQELNKIQVELPKTPKNIKMLIKVSELERLIYNYLNTK